MSTTGRELEGILLVDKPPEWTSHDVVKKIRNLFRVKKVGHAGTLDPMATGLLLLLVGRATKASNFLMSQPKSYEGTLELGTTTDSQDADGEVLQQRPVPPLTATDLGETFRSFLGDQYQMPPMFSAKKVKGVPLHKMARKGLEVEREPRFVHIARFDLLDLRLPEVDFRMEVSKGTYVRTVAHDLGEKLGCGAYLKRLRRTAIDAIPVDRAVSIDTLTAAPPSQLGRFLHPIHEFVPSHVL